MSMRDYMRDGRPRAAARSHERRVGAQTRAGYSKVELAMAAAGFIAWLWCAGEVLRAVAF